MKIREYLTEGVRQAAYWFSPKDEMIEVGSDNHISVVLKNPQKFGYTIETIKEIYDKFNEPLGQEGRAREEIIISLIKKGWLRLRRYRQYWSVNVYNWNRRTEKIISEWAFGMINGDYKDKEDDKYIDVKITAFKGNPPQFLSIGEIARGFNESKKRKIKQKLITEIADEI